MTKGIACRSLGSPRRRSRIFSIREEYCFYVADNEYGYYLPNGTKVSHPFGMLVQQTLGEQGHITVRISKQIFNNVPAIRYTIATFDPETSNPDTLYQGGSSAADVFPGTSDVFGGEINGYGEISAGGIGVLKNYTIYYVYDGINPIVEYTPNGSVKKKYVYAGGRHIATIAGADTNSYHCDALGSVRRVTNESGQNKWKTRYYPFGEMFQTQGTGNTHTFTGKEWDAEMNLNYFCQRYYDPEIGRFMTLDPLGDAVSSPYTYCVNNPLKYIDPLGLQPPDEYDEYPFINPGYGFRPRRYGFVHPGILPGLMGFTMKHGLWTSGVMTGDMLDLLHSLNPPGLSDQMRQSAAATPPDPYIGGWIRTFLTVGSWILDIGEILHIYIRPLLPSSPPELPSPYISPPSEEESSSSGSKVRSGSKFANYPYPIMTPNDTWYHLKDEIWNPNYPHNQGASQYDPYYGPPVLS